MTASHRSLLAFCGYTALALASAYAVCVVIRPAPPPPIEPLVARTAADAAILREALKIKTGTAVLIEFFDFQCPPCRQTWPNVRAFLKAHPEVGYHDVNFPLKIHPYAFPAAVASMIARDGSKRERVFNDLFSGRCNLDPSALNVYLRGVGLPGVVGTAKAAAYERRVKQEIELGKSLQVEATPTLLAISSKGEMYEVRSLDALDRMLR